MVKFQKNNGLSVDGLIGKNTDSKISEKYEETQKLIQLETLNYIEIGMTKVEIEAVMGIANLTEKSNENLICTYGKSKIIYNLENGIYTAINYDNQGDLKLSYLNEFEGLKVWLGMTKEELVNSMGNPECVTNESFMYSYKDLSIVFDENGKLIQYLNEGNTMIWSRVPTKEILVLGDSKEKAIISLGAPYIAFKDNINNVDVWMHDEAVIYFQNNVITLINYKSN